MRIPAIIFFATFFYASLLHAEVLEELWAKYAPPEMVHNDLPTPGSIYGQAPGTGEASFSYQWKYRPQTYEMHFQDPEKLARGIYSVALSAKDIQPDLPREKFYRGVTGFHYSAPQLAAWLNEALASNIALTKEESEFAGELLKEGILVIGTDGFAPGGEIRHVLGAAPGKKRSFADNLLHERLHVFWDENEQMRNVAGNAWAQISESGKDAIRQRLKNYNQENEKQLQEEWAILEAEKNGFNIK